MARRVFSICILLVVVTTHSMALQLMAPLHSDGSGALGVPSQQSSEKPYIPDDCTPQRLIVFKQGSVRYSNLGARGPQIDQPPFLVYGNVTPSGNAEQVIDLQVMVRRGNYTPLNSSMNGLNGAYGIINVAAGTTVDLAFRFVDSITGGEVALKHEFIFSFFDMDTAGINKTVESITVSGFQAYNLSDSSEVNVTTGTPKTGPRKTTVFTATELGNRKDNPTYPLGLTHAQMHRTFSLNFSANTSAFNVTLGAATPPGAVMGGRNFMFSGPSTLVCPARALCSSFKCPSGFDPRPDPAYIACAGGKCNAENDTNTCCCSGDASFYTFDDIYYPEAFADGELNELFSDMAPGLNKLIDMTLKNTSVYTAIDGTIHQTSYGKINMALNSSANFTFSFTNRDTGKPFSLPPFRMSFFDIDEHHTCTEQLSIAGLDSYTLADNSSVKVTKASGKTTFSSEGTGDGTENPTEYPLSDAQKAREVVVTFPSVTNFTITLAVGPNCTDGRNLMFSRPASIGFCKA